MSSNDPVAAFRVEAADLFDQVEQALLDLGHRLTDQDLIDSVFRGLHTLKGSGAMFGFDALATFTHHCESAFDRVRKGLAPATPELVAVILSAMDHMRALVDGDDPSLQAPGDAILARLHAVIGAVSATPANTAAAPADTAVTTGGWRVFFRLPPDAMVNGTNPLVLLDELRELGDCRVVARTDAIPPLPALNATECHVGWDVELRGDVSREDIEDVFIFVMDDMTLSIEPIAADPVAAPADAISDEAPAIAEAAGETAAGRPAKAAGDSVRVPAERLDVLMDRVGELVIVQSRLSQLAHGDLRGPTAELALRSISEEIERLSGEMRDAMMVLRMAPVGALFGRFRRLVHDLARETGKSIALLTDGENTEVDKTVAERLADPIVHLIRNSCDHGLETEAERIAAGKPAAGQIRLTAQ